MNNHLAKVVAVLRWVAFFVLGFVATNIVALAIFERLGGLPPWIVTGAVCAEALCLGLIFGLALGKKYVLSVICDALLAVAWMYI